MLDTIVPTETVAVRNLSKTNVIISGETKGASIEWGYAGIPDGSDLQEVPRHLWNSAHMRRAKAKGLLAEDSMESMDAAFNQQRAHLAQQAAERQAEVNAALKAGANGAAIVITEDALTEHMDRVAKSQPSDALEVATQKQVEANAAAEAAFAEAQAGAGAFIPNPVTALDAALD